MMYLHAGNGKNIRVKHIIGIFDTDNATVSGTTRQFLSKADSRGEVVAAREEIPKAFILYEENNKKRICFSQLSSTVLVGRTEMGEE